ncbi:2-Hydroxyacid oxidase 1-like [Ptychodera flava]|uniref:2-Hydroxyacid oxidase 1-like n=1 Tax=Ptychodera flava TaxID=63121 RepID=UPI003969D799
MMSKPMLVCVDDYENYAREHLDRQTLIYFTTGADEEITVKENRDAFKRLRLRPRILRDVSKRDLSTSILGHHVDFPICIAPSGAHCLAFHEGELATVKAAATMKTCMVLSTATTKSIEEVSQTASHCLRWFQLYVWGARKVSEDLVRRVEAAGFKALVLTVDVPYAGKRRQGSLGFQGFKFPPHLELKYMPREATNTQAEKLTDSKSTSSPFVQYFDASLTWECIEWLKSITSLPIILKGILTPEDALLAVQHKVAGIVVSNHGGRQLDYVPATIEALPKIVEAVKDQIEVYMDGGVRTGTDVFKALALGAKAVFVGRPIIYGLSYAGEEGARQVLQILRDELSLTMALSGCSKINDIKPQYVVHQSHFAKL